MLHDKSSFVNRNFDSYLKIKKKCPYAAFQILDMCSNLKFDITILIKM